jgi:3-hydroxyacyl-[acyl-carrier-protein] dehydratase
MHFDLVDRVIELTDDRVVTVKLVSAGEEYLQDHFATFPVLPGVLMIEAIVQAARLLVEADRPAPVPYVLGSARAIKYGSFVKPGSGLRVEVALHKRHDDGSVELNARATLITPEDDDPRRGGVAAGGRITLRPARI